MKYEHSKKRLLRLILRTPYEIRTLFLKACETRLPLSGKEYRAVKLRLSLLADEREIAAHALIKAIGEKQDVVNWAAEILENLLSETRTLPDKTHPS